MKEVDNTKKVDFSNCGGVLDMQEAILSEYFGDRFRADANGTFVNRTSQNYYSATTLQLCDKEDAEWHFQGAVKGGFYIRHCKPRAAQVAHKNAKKMDVKFNTDNTATVITDGMPITVADVKDFLNENLPFGVVADKLILSGTNTLTFTVKTV